jgi:hypothetical protein
MLHEYFHNKTNLYLALIVDLKIETLKIRELTSIHIHLTALSISESIILDFGPGKIIHGFFIPEVNKMVVKNPEFCLMF